MANKIMGITIDIEGKTSGLTKSLQDANTAISKTTSALKDVDKALQLDPTNVELMAQKQALLEKQIVQTSEKLDVMKQVADDANEALARGDISQEQYASLTAELSKTDSALSQLAEEARDNADAMEDVENGTAGAADEMDDVSEGADEASGHLDALKGVAIAVGAEMAAAFGACVEAIKEVGGAMIDSTVSAGDYVDEVNTLSMKTGISSERLQEMNYVTGLIDVSVETMTGSMTKLEKSMSSANKTNEKYEEKMAALNEQLEAGKITQEEWVEKAEEIEASTVTAYDKLGISITDVNGNLRDNEEVFWEVIDALGNMEDGTERDLMAMELLGKSAKELNPLIEAGSEKFNELAQEAHDVGYVMDQETMDSFQAFDDQMERLNKSSESAKNALGTVLLPILGDLGETATDALSEFTLAMNEADGDVDKMGDAISNILKKVLESVNKVAPKLFSLLGTIVNTLLQILIDNLPEFVSTAMSILESLTSTLITPENIAKIANAATTIVMSLLTYITQNLDKILNAALMIIQSLLSGLQENLPLIIPAAIDAILTFAETLLAPENLEMLLNAVLEITLAVASAIIEHLPEIIESLVTIISGIVTFLLSPDGIGQIVETGYKLLVSLVEKLPEALVEIIKGISGIVDDILKAFGFDEGLGKGLTEIWDGIWGMIKGVINTVIGGINGMISAVESAINFVIDCINTLSWDIPSWVPLIGGETFGFDIPNVSFYKIPELATGAVIPPNNPFLAVLGDQTSGVNIEAPLETIKNALVDALHEQGNLGPVYVTAYFGDESVGTVVANANRNNNYISGGR